MMGASAGLLLAAWAVLSVCLAAADVASPPVIDVAPIILPEAHTAQQIAQTLQEIRRASIDWGFYNVINHGITQDLQDRVFAQTAAFFAAPMALRDAVRRNVTNSRGYADVEYTKQRVDRKEVFDVGPLSMDQRLLSAQGLRDYALDGVNMWPQDEDEERLPLFRSTVEEYYEAVHRLSVSLLRATGQSMGCLPPQEQGTEEQGDVWGDFFGEAFSQHSSLLRLNHYPLRMDEQQPAVPYDQLGVGQHTDAGGLTVLLQDQVGGLQVYTGSKQEHGNGHWVPVNPVPGAVTINIGDMLQIWSNDVLKAAQHRVLASSNAERYSLPFFFNPNYDTLVTPLLCQPDEVSSGEARPRFKPVRWGDFRSERYLGDFGDFGEEIQIDQFKEQGKEEL